MLCQRHTRKFIPFYSKDNTERAICQTWRAAVIVQASKAGTQTNADGLPSIHVRLRLSASITPKCEPYQATIP